MNISEENKITFWKDYRSPEMECGRGHKSLDVIWRRIELLRAMSQDKSNENLSIKFNVFR